MEVRTGRSLSSLLLVFFLTLCFSAGTLSSDPADFISASRGATNYPALCVECLKSYAQEANQSLRDHAMAALRATARQAQSASTFVSQFASGDKNNGSREDVAVQDCLENMQDCVENLRRSVREMRRIERDPSRRIKQHLSNIETWLSAAIADVDTCLDSLSENAGEKVRAAIQSKVVKVSNLTSNALALVSGLDPGN